MAENTANSSIYPSPSYGLGWRERFTTWNDLFTAVINTNDDIQGLVTDAQKKAEEILKTAG